MKVVRSQRKNLVGFFIKGKIVFVDILRTGINLL